MAMCKRHPLAGWLFAGLLGMAGPAFSQSNVGFVSLDRILRDAAPAQAAQKKLEQEFSKRAQELQKQAENLKKQQETLEKDAMTMSESDRLRRERDFGEASREFQRKQRDFNEELGQRRKQEFEQVIERANRAVRQIAEAEKLDIVFQNEQVVWASSRIDITQKVIDALSETRAGK